MALGTLRSFLLLVVAFALAACTDGSVGDPRDAGEVPRSDGGGKLPDGGLPDGGDEEPPDAGPYGYDSRPANPTCVAPARPVVNSGVALARAFPNLTFDLPMMLIQAPSDPARVFVMKRAGEIVSFPKSDAATPGQVKRFVDLTSKVNGSGEGGLLGMAFHPRWATDRKELFVSYTETGSGGRPLRSVIARLKSLDGGLTVDASTEERLLTLDQPYDNHNGGNIAFGPDGYLYVGFGDGGSGGDPLGTGQRINTLLGKFLRLDVNVPAAQKYGIPSTNPYAPPRGAPCNLSASAYDAPAGSKCSEIYALGFRNPWRWSFDTGTGELWVGDVGQNAWEEVDQVVLGGNYGWSVREGKHCYNAATCNTAGLIDPVLDYDRTQGVSITGGYVYRGAAIPGLVGKFIYGDYGSGRIWAVASNATTGAPEAQLLVDTNLALSSFGQTLDGEVYAVHIDPAGEIHKLVPQGAQPPDTFPKKLSQTGCFQAAAPTLPVAGLIPYDLNAALWSDGATKERHFAIPDGATIDLAADGDFTLPNGSVVTKTFFLAGKRVETRLLVRHADGNWAGYSYEWDDAETDATLLPAGKTKAVAGQSWTFPSRAQCLGCHTGTAGRTLGLELSQLNRTFKYPTRRTRNQVETLDALGYFTTPLPNPVPRLESPFGTGPLEARARAYLHANCSICHRQGAGQGPADFRAQLTFQQTNTCDVGPQNGSLGLTNPKLIAPGVPGRSLVSVRMHALTAYRMPPLGTSRVDAAGTALIDEWIGSLTACP